MPSRIERGADRAGRSQKGASLAEALRRAMGINMLTTEDTEFRKKTIERAI